MAELHNILKVTGCDDFFDNLEKCSEQKAIEMGFNGADEEYFRYIYTTDNGSHQ